MENESLIHVEKPADKARLLEVLNKVPVSVLTADAAAVIWLDEIKRIANQLK